MCVYIYIYRYVYRHKNIHIHTCHVHNPKPKVPKDSTVSSLAAVDTVGAMDVRITFLPSLHEGTMGNLNPKP